MSRRRKKRDAKKQSPAPTTESVAQPVEAETVVVTTPGSELCAAREAEGMSCIDVANTLKLPVAVIQHLENDEYAELPGLAFSIGYLRAYAKHLSLDGDALVEQVKSMQSSMSDPVLVAQAVPVLDKVSGSDEHSGVSTGLLVLIPLLLLGLAVWWFLIPNTPNNSDDRQENRLVSQILGAEEPQTELAQATLELKKPKLEALDTEEKQSPRSVAQAIETNEPSSAVSFESTTNSSPEESSLIEQLTVAQNAVSPDKLPVQTQVTSRELARQENSPVVFENGARRITSLGNDVLEFSFTNDSWVSVKTNERKELYGNLSRAGTTLKLIGQGPFRVLLGYAPGASLSVNEEAINLQAYTRNNVARMVVAQ